MIRQFHGINYLSWNRFLKKTTTAEIARNWGHAKLLNSLLLKLTRVAVISAKNHKRQRRKRQTVTAKREKSQTSKVLTAILTLPNLTQPNLTQPNLTWPNLTYTNFGVCDFSPLAVTDWRLRRWRLWFLALSNAPQLTLRLVSWHHHRSRRNSQKFTRIWTYTVDFFRAV